MKKVIVTSNNPVKIEATRLGFTKMFPQEEFQFEGVSVKSGVSDQPMSDSEIYTGAMNRVKNAMSEHEGADFYIGLEGGVQEREGELEAYAWMVIISKDNKLGHAKTGSFFLPKKVKELIHEGKELGEADDIIFGKTNSKQSNGSVGILTHDLITRTTYYADAVVLALIPFVHPELY